MKHLLHLKCICFLAFIFLFKSHQANAQCIAGYTRDTLKWDYLDFLPNTGRYIAPTAYINLAKSQTQYFTFGTQNVKVTHNYSGSNDPGDDATHTGSAGSYGTGADVHFLGNGVVTITFDSAVQAAKFSLYDIDRSQRVTVTALNGIIPVAVTMARVSGTVLTIAGSGTFSASATASLTNLANTSTDGTANVDIAGPVTSITLTITLTSTGGGGSGEDGSFWISDVIACSKGSLPSNYYAVSKPFTNQPAYVLMSLDSNVYYINADNGAAKFLFKDPGGKTINSMAYDPYRHMVYYTHSLTGAAVTERTLRRYDYEQDTVGIVTSNVNSFGIPTYESGVESGGAAFYNGSLYLGIEGYAASGANSGRESAVWKMDFNAAYALTGNYAMAFAVPGDDGAGTLLHDWADFGISNGVLYDFDGAASDKNFYHKNLLTGGTINYTPSPSTLTPKQVAVDWTGQVYNIGGASTGTRGIIAPYNYNGTVNIPLEDTIKYNGVAITGSWGDGAEAFKPKTDFGDAPASYDPASSDPATHEIINNLRLGSLIDIEFAKKTSAAANGDNYDDGVPALLVIPNGISNYLQAVNVYNNTGVNATLIGWIDANGDGLFQSGEGRSVTVPSNPAVQSVNILWTAINVTLPIGSATFIRFRLTTRPGMTTATPNGFFENGEVEDYPVTVTAVLPAENVLLTAKKINTNTTAVNWKPVSETTFTGYELQRSADGANWQTIYTTSIVPLNNLNYNYTDLNPSVPYSYYRINLLKSSGAFLYSNIAKLDFAAKNNISISPNPAKSTTALTVQSVLAGAAAVNIIDYLGKAVYQQNIILIKGENKILLPVVEKLSAGIYKVRVLLNNEVLSTNLIVIE
jgi:GEVED domain